MTVLSKAHSGAPRLVSSRLDAFGTRTPFFDSRWPGRKSPRGTQSATRRRVEYEELESSWL